MALDFVTGGLHELGPAPNANGFFQQNTWPTPMFQPEKHRKYCGLIENCVKLYQLNVDVSHVLCSNSIDVISTCARQYDGGFKNTE